LRAYLPVNVALVAGGKASVELKPIFDAINRERGVGLEFRIREGSKDSEREEKWLTYFNCFAQSAPVADSKASVGVGVEEQWSRRLEGEAD